MTAKVELPIDNPNDTRLWPVLFVETASHISGATSAYRINHILVTENVYRTLVERAKQTSGQVLVTDVWGL